MDNCLGYGTDTLCVFKFKYILKKTMVGNISENLISTILLKGL